MLIATSCGHSPTNLPPPAILEIEGNGSCKFRGLTVTGKWGEGDRVLLEAVWYQIFQRVQKFSLQKYFWFKYKTNKNKNLNTLWYNKNIKKPKIDGQLSKEKVMSETLALSTEDTLSPLSQNMPSSLSSWVFPGDSHVFCYSSVSQRFTCHGQEVILIFWITL